MYISRLNSDKKHMFLDLELYISKTDGDFSESEKQIIDVHCMEMHIDNNNYECELPFDELLRKLKEDCTVEEKHIIFIELLAVVMADNVYHESEKKIIDRLSEMLDIKENEVKKAFDAVNKMREAYEEFAHFVLVV